MPFRPLPFAAPLQNHFPWRLPHCDISLQELPQVKRTEKMKIFNWVHRKFNHGCLKDGLARDVTRGELVTTEANKQALLKQVALVDVLEGWKDGILTIGTLGFDPILEFSTKQKGYFILGSEAEKKLVGGEKQDEQELDFSAECENYDDSDSDEVDDHQMVVSVTSDDEEEVNPLILSAGAKKPATVEELADGVSTEMDLPMEANPIGVTEICDQGKTKGGRVTLAELFRAETDMGKKKEHVGGFEKKSVAGSKNGLSFAKKLIPHSQEKTRPIKNLNRFMRKMLKRKIHPEIEGKGCKMSGDAENKPGKAEARLDMGSNAGDSTILLPSTSKGV